MPDDLTDRLNRAAATAASPERAALWREASRAVAERDALIDQWIYLSAAEGTDDPGGVEWVAITPRPRSPGETVEHYCGTKPEAVAAVRLAAGLVSGEEAAPCIP